jgi:hydroxypyruvate isomerase
LGNRHLSGLGLRNKDQAMRHSVSIKFMWADLPLRERARRAAEAGFDCVELWDWRGEDIQGLGQECQEAGIEIAGFFGHSRGGLADPSQHREVIECLAESIDVADEVGARQLLMFSDEILPDSTIRRPPPLTDAERRRAMVDGLGACVSLVQGKSLELVIESINPISVPGYFLRDADASIDVCQQLDHPQMRMYFDCFHEHMSGGQVIERMLDSLPWVTAIHIADAPGRHQPGTGEIDFRAIRRVLDRAAYDGQLSFEVDPVNGDSESAVAAIKEVFPF